MEIGDVYFNAGNRPTIRTPLIAKNRTEARRWLVANLLIREPNAENIQCTDIWSSPYTKRKLLAVKQYRRHYWYKGKHYTDIQHYPESDSGRLTQLYG